MPLSSKEGGKAAVKEGEPEDLPCEKPGLCGETGGNGDARGQESRVQPFVYIARRVFLFPESGIALFGRRPPGSRLRAGRNERRESGKAPFAGKAGKESHRLKKAGRMQIRPGIQGLRNCSAAPLSPPFARHQVFFLPAS